LAFLLGGRSLGRGFLDMFEEPAELVDGGGEGAGRSEDEGEEGGDVLGSEEEMVGDARHWGGGGKGKGEGEERSVLRRLGGMRDHQFCAPGHL
jgi:hypothetical protein